MAAIKVLVVDDSALVREVISQLLLEDREIEVIGTAIDPFDARDKIKQLKPDVITLDVEMPRMDGITFLRNLMKLNPMPVVMLSSLTHEGADVTLQALELGAVDYIPKPNSDADLSILETFQSELINKIKAAAASANKIKFHRRHQPVALTPDTKVTLHNNLQLIAIGASTGGTEALADLLCQLPGNMPPILITQHIPASFSERFARRLNELTQLKVQQAGDDDLLKRGHVYIAPGDRHLTAVKKGNQLHCQLSDSKEINRHKPSVEVMFNSLQSISPWQVTAILLTGMGEDGSMAMKKLADCGCHTIAQDEASSLVWGMPGAAVKYNAAKEVISLPKLPQRLINLMAAREQGEAG